MRNTKQIRNTFHAVTAAIEPMEQRVMLSTTLTGTVIGTPGSYQNAGNVAAKAFDGNINTYFDAPTSSESYTGLKLASAAVISQIKFAPRNGFASRMVGGLFQGSHTADFSSGVTTLYKITAAPVSGSYTTVSISNTSSFEYVRYLGPANSECNVGEIQFIGTAAASGPATLLSDGTLLVSGTNGADTIAVNFDQFLTPSVEVTVNGVQQTFGWASVKSVVIKSMNGNDNVNVQGGDGQTNPPDIRPISVIAGDGNDTFYENLITDGSDDYQVASINITAGNGNNSFELDGSSETVTVVAGNGNNNFVTNIYGNGSLTANITAGDGNNRLNTGTTGGAGGQTVTFNAGTGHNDIINSDSDDHDTGTLGGAAYTIQYTQEILAGKIYADVNGDGKYELGEPLVGGAPVSFTNNIVGTFSTTTDANGNYSLPINFTFDPRDTVNYGGGQAVSLTVGELKSGIDIALPQPAIGNVIGTPGSYQNNGNAAYKAFDGDITTYFDGPTANGDYAGRDLGGPTVITAIAFAPRSGLTSRMVGGVFQGSNAANFTGAVNLYTITTAPRAGLLTEIPVTNSTAFRYVRYVGPNGSYGNVAEAQFFSDDTPVKYASLSTSGLLTINGTSGADDIQVKIYDQQYDGSANTVFVTVDNIAQTFDANLVRGIVINTGDGNDTVSVTGSYEVNTNFSPAIDPTYNFATTITAGNGNDTITTQVYSDFTYESPADVIHLGNGTDSVTINQDGADTVYCGSGNDTIRGDATDGGGLYVYGGSGNDTVIGDGFTSDFFYGGTGTNTYIEGPDFGLSNVDVNLNGPNLTNIQYYYADDSADHITVEAGPTTRQIVMDDLDHVTVTGGNGDEYIHVNANDVLINTGNGNNTVDVFAGSSGTVNGGSGNDIIDDNSIFGGGPVTINGGGGTNTAYTKPGDTVTNIQILNPKAVAYTGTLIATSGSYQNNGNTAGKAFDGNLSNYFDGPTANGNFVGLDLGSSKLISAASYAPRVGFAQRMVGGIFQTSNSADFSNPVNVATIMAAPTAGQLNTLVFSRAAFARYIRYLSPDGSYGNVAEIQFLSPG